MPQCKNCHRQISDYDKDICPYCGQKNPIPVDYQTSDITQTLNPVSGDYKLYRSKSRKTAGILCLALGFVGAHDFYLAFYKRAIIEIAVFLAVFFGGGFLLYYLSNLGGWGFALAFLVNWVVYAPLSIRYFTKDSLKDGNGEFLH